MDGEGNGTQTQQDAQQQGQAAQQQPQQQEAQGQQEQVPAAAGGVDAGVLAARQDARDSRIAELEGQIAEASRSAEVADALRAEIAALRAAGDEQRVEFALQMAGCRNVKAARAVLEDYGDVDALKAAEPWLFQDAAGAPAAAAGATGLPNAGVAADEGRDVKHWRALAGLDG